MKPNLTSRRRLTILAKIASRHAAACSGHSAELFRDLEGYIRRARRLVGVDSLEASASWGLAEFVAYDLLPNVKGRTREERARCAAIRRSMRVA